MTSSRHSGQELTPEAGSLLAIARLGRPHGVRGEIRAEALCPPVLSFPDLAQGGALWLRREGSAPRRVTVEGLRPHQDMWLLTLEGLADRDEADALRGGELCLERSKLPELPEGWYWEDDLVGLPVVDRELGAIGEVTGLDTAGAQSMLAVRQESSTGDRILIPWVRAFVQKVDLEAGRIEVDLPADYPGLS